MPTVPTYDNPQVTPQPLPASRQESVASPALFAGAYEGAQKASEGLMTAGTGLAAVAYQMQQKDDLRAVQDASTEHTKQIAQWQEAAQRDRQNSNAQGLLKDFSEWHTKSVGEIRKTLTSDAQRAAFDNVAARTGEAARHDVATYEIHQTRVAGQQAEIAMAKVNTDAGATALSPEAVDTYKQNLINGTRAYDAANGIASDVTAQRVAERLTEFHAQRIASLARVDPAGAAAYALANEKEITGKGRENIMKFADKTGANNEGVKSAGDIYSKMAGQGIDKMEQAARDLYPNDETRREATISSLQQRDAARKAGEAERIDAPAASLIQKSMKGATVSQLRSDPELIRLSTMGAAGATRAAQILDHAQSKADQALSRAAAVESRAYTAEMRTAHREKVEQDHKYWNLVANPDALMAMTPTQILNSALTIGDENAQKALAKYEMYSKNQAALSGAKVDTNQFNYFAKKVGLDPLKKSPNEAEKQTLSDLRGDLERTLGVEQQNKKRPLTREEKDKFIQQEIDKKVFLNNRIFPNSYDPRSKAEILLTPQEQEKAFVMVNGQEFRLSQIPPTERTKIIGALRRKGQAISEQAIAELYVDGQRNSW